MECEQFVKDHFMYDGIIVKNPTDAMTVPRLPCALVTWGLCQKSSILEHCKNGTANLYQLMKQKKIGRKDFPMALTMKMYSIEQRCLIADTLGKGDVVFLVKAEDRGAWWRLQRADKVAGSRPEPCNMTSQVALSQRISSAAEREGLLPSQVAYFDARLSKFVPQNRDNELVFQLVPDKQHACFRVPLNMKLKATKSAKKKAEAEQDVKLPLGLLDVASDAGLTTFAPIDAKHEVDVAEDDDKVNEMGDTSDEDSDA